MADCTIKDCSGTMRRMWPQRGPIDATPFRCDVCGREAHAAICVDEDGQVECICGLAEIDEKRAGVQQ